MNTARAGGVSAIRVERTFAAVEGADVVYMDTSGDPEDAFLLSSAWQVPPPRPPPPPLLLPLLQPPAPAPSPLADACSFLLLCPKPSKRICYQWCLAQAIHSLESQKAVRGQN